MVLLTNDEQQDVLWAVSYVHNSRLHQRKFITRSSVIGGYKLYEGGIGVARIRTS